MPRERTQLQAPNERERETHSHVELDGSKVHPHRWICVWACASRRTSRCSLVGLGSTGKDRSTRLSKFKASIAFREALEDDAMVLDTGGGGGGVVEQYEFTHGLFACCGSRVRRYDSMNGLVIGW